METVIEVAGLSKAYPSRRGTVHALSDVNFSAYRGEVLGIVGPNGSGKTTMLRCALGLVHPSAGSVQVLGHSVDKLEMVAGDIGAVIESPKVFRTMSARKWLRLYCVIDNLPLTRIDEVLDLVGLDTSLSILDALYEEFRDPNYAAVPALRRMVTAGQFGRKSGLGFYDYSKK